MIKVYNTLTRRKEEFRPLGKEIKWYNCGPTVYDYIHIGNARNLVSFDIIRRYLEYRGFKVKFVQNFTDIDDKMIKRAKELNIPVKELAERFIKQYFEDAKLLRIKKATIHPKATEHIKDIISFIKDLEKKGYTYETDDGVYFNITKFRDYGKLSKQSIEKLKAGARVEKNENKRNPLDFVLWKKHKPQEPCWDSPWGKGRPGWHIECSVMAITHLGSTLDIHSGGQDLIFPHHENEIAQSEALTGKSFVKYWLHNAFLTIRKEKMSKSLGNILTAHEVLKRYDPRVIRLFFFTTHYRSPIDFSETTIEQTQHSLERLDNFIITIKNIKKNQGVDISKLIIETRKRFINAMDDDFDTPKALAVIFEFIRKVNQLIHRWVLHHYKVLSWELVVVI